MAGLYLLGLLACVVPLASFQPFRPLLIVTESCYEPLNMTYVTEELEAVNVTVDLLEQNVNICVLDQKDVFLAFSPKKGNQYNISDTCNSKRLLHTLKPGSELILGSFHPEICEPLRYYSQFFNVTLRTWNCPTISVDGTGPSTIDTAKAFARLVDDMKWKSVAILTIESGWWPTLSQSLDLELRNLEIVPKHSFLFKANASLEYIETKLNILKQAPCRALILCMPSSELGMGVFDVVRNLNLSSQNTLFILMDVFALPSWRFRLGNSDNKTTNLTQDVLLFVDNDTSTNAVTTERQIVKNVRESVSGIVPTKCFALAEQFMNGSLRSLVIVMDFNRTETIPNNFEQWWNTHRQLDECDALCSALNVGPIGMYWAISSGVLLVICILGAAIVFRYRLLQKRLSKAPYKVLLEPSDFTFPQLSSNLRVDEGIEAMLCCWLQQLQEFGGPEVEKPDLLQNSGGASARTPLHTGSSPNLTKQVIVDPRVRYKGDLVQMKPVPSNNGNTELKVKALEVLVLIHGLRHENLNPLIGILVEPPTAALVSEYCSRGSLQDVLERDDIKLDWSFRLSLLTDLVRGMKYLHSSQVRVHGNLSSRNCVIDARWVLKVTDYGLLPFYEAQGIQLPPKSARDLLWTAPELLRNPALQKKGTQPGDVYAFGIIMQEVLIRGEPFCSNRLSPETIIEKVKKPPPLIRPSVSKAAAPPEGINIMRQCWSEQPELRPDFNAINEQFKKLNHGRKVNIVDTMFQMLETYSNNLEELIRTRTEQLDMEKKKTEQLLNRMLPSYVAEKLKLGMPVDPEEYSEVTIYFSDIVGFTTISAHSTPFQVVDLLNDLYTCFDATINAYNVYKVETIGDAYMVVGGLPVRIRDHAEQIATMALDLLHESGKFRIRHLPNTPLRLRIGLHTGPCCAGVVGLTMPRYCLFGDTVNTASRMESTGAAWRIHLSGATRIRLERAGGFRITYRGRTEIKGKGTMDTYWLLGRKGFNKELPIPPSIEESHGIDESLILNTLPTIPTVDDEYALVDLGMDNYSKNLGVKENVTKTPSPNPTFFKTMEQSKFKSLAGKPKKEKSTMVRSYSSDAPLFYASPVSAAEVAAALLQATSSYRRGQFSNNYKDEDEDICTPYNHYRCLSPKPPTLLMRRPRPPLLRQFSLDSSEEPITQTDDAEVTSSKLSKPNSSGATDLEEIEEIPLQMPLSAQLQSFLKASIDSLESD